jgi:hypothetical protein
MEEDPNNNPHVPIGGLTLGNNPDGTFTVSSASHVVTIGTPSAPPKKYGHRGGIVVVGAVAGENLPEGTISVRSAGELEDKLKSKVSAADKTRGTGHTTPKELHFSLKGLHTLDLGKLSAIIGGQSSSIAAHIHLDSDDNAKMPPGG